MKHKNGTWYYFIKSELCGKNTKDIDIVVFPWKGIFSRTAGKITGIIALFTDLVLGEPQDFLLLPIKQGDKTRFYSGDNAYTVTVGANERVTVPAGTFEYCARITARADKSEQVNTFWLAPNVGMVKSKVELERGMGSFLDELREFTIPR
jgi:hypothetical protein